MLLISVFENRREFVVLGEALAPDQLLEHILVFLPRAEAFHMLVEELAPKSDQLRRFNATDLKYTVQLQERVPVYLCFPTVSVKAYTQL